jgi:HAD superfamily hydrolase (TIGR01509 family)
MGEVHVYSSKFDMLVNLTEGKYDAFLYDCDGTLADNMQAHKDAYVKVAANHGLDLDPAIIDEFAGLPTVRVVEEINKRYNTDFEPKTFADAKSGVFYDEYMEHTKPVDFVVAHLLSHAGKTKVGVVSGGRRKTVEKTLETLGLLDKIDVLVCAGETPHGKPYPDPFLSAAEKLGVNPAKCMVFEDGDPGVRAAEAAGMKWVRIDWI